MVVQGKLVAHENLAARIATLQQERGARMQVSNITRYVNLSCQVGMGRWQLACRAVQGIRLGNGRTAHTAEGDACTEFGKEDGTRE